MKKYDDISIFEQAGRILVEAYQDLPCDYARAGRE